MWFNFTNFTLLTVFNRVGATTHISMIAAEHENLVY